MTKKQEKIHEEQQKEQVNCETYNDIQKDIQKDPQTIKHEIQFLHQLFEDKLKIIGDFWSLLILYDLKTGPKRFSCILTDAQSPISPATLTQRLKRLVHAGFLSRTEKIHDKQSVSYELTKIGQAFLPILGSIETFVRKFFFMEYSGCQKK